MTIALYAKAVAAAVSAAAASVATAALDGIITPTEWALVAAAAIVAGVGVFGVPNATKETDEQKAEKAAAAEFNFQPAGDDYVGAHRAPDAAE